MKSPSINRLPSKVILVLGLLVGLPGMAYAAAPEKVIFETDWQFDVDDVGALATLHGLANEGKAEILGVSYNEVHWAAPGALDAVNTWYNRGTIPIGYYNKPLSAPDADHYNTTLNGMPHNNGDNLLTDSLTMYKTVLAAQPDQSVTIISVGFMNNLYDLLNDPAGYALVQSKVKMLAVMGGLNGDDFNFTRHNLVGQTQSVIQNWPGPLVITQVGTEFLSGENLCSAPANSPVRKAFEIWTGWCGNGRYSWDEVTTLFGVMGTAFYSVSWSGSGSLTNGYSWSLCSACAKPRGYAWPKNNGTTDAEIDRLILLPPVPAGTPTVTPTYAGTPTQTPTFTASPTPGTDTIVVPCTAATMTVDGDLSEPAWAAASWTPMTLCWNGPCSGSNAAQVKLLWDATRLYVAVSVTDPALFNDSANWWDDDGVEMYFGHNPLSATFDGNDWQFQTQYDGSGLTASSGGTAGLNVASSIGGGGYTMEWSITWARLAATPAAGAQFGFDVAANFDDNGGVRESQKGFWGDNTTYSNPSKFGQILLSSCAAATAIPSATPTTTVTGTPSATPTLSATAILTSVASSTPTGTLVPPTNTPVDTPTIDISAPQELKVNGIYLQTVSTGCNIRLTGVNVGVLEAMPIGYGPPGGWGGDTSALVTEAIRNWNANAVRLSISQDFWFGYTNSKGNPGSAAAYRARVDACVNAAASLNAYVEFDLHWSGQGSWGTATDTWGMPDDNSIAFWTDVANRYKNNPAVLFNLYNEPKGEPWSVWQAGGTTGGGFHTPGFQALVKTIRDTGAKNVIVIGGLGWAWNLTQIAAYPIVDTNSAGNMSGNGLMYEAHIYDNKGGTTAQDKTNLREANVGWAVSNGYCVMIGEFGKGSGATYNNSGCEPFETDLIQWIDGNNLNSHQYNAMAWNFNYVSCPCILSNYFSPTTCHGAAVQAWLAAVTPPPACVTDTPTPVGTATPTFSYSPTFTATPTGVPPVAGDMLDDLEDGNNQIVVQGGRNGFWFESGGGAMTFDAPGDASVNAANYFHAAPGGTGLLAFNITGPPGPWDASAYIGVRMRIRVAAATQTSIDIQLRDAPGVNAVTSIVAGTGWQTFEAYFSINPAMDPAQLRQVRLSFNSALPWDISWDNIELIPAPPTPTATPSASPSATNSPVANTATHTASPTPSPTNSPSGTATPSVSPTATETPALTSTDTPSSTPSPSPSLTATETDVVSPTETPTSSATPDETFTASPTLTVSQTTSPTSVNTASPTATETGTSTASPSVTATSTEVQSPTETPTPSDTPVGTLTNTPSFTVTLTATPTLTVTLSVTPTLTPTCACIVTPTFTQTATRTVTPTYTQTVTLTASPTPGSIDPAGQGSLAVSPALFETGQPAVLIEIVYTAGAALFSNGTVTFNLPVGWPAPQTIDNSEAAYIEVTSGGTVNSVVIAGQQVTVSFTSTVPGETLTLAYGSGNSLLVPDAAGTYLVSATSDPANLGSPLPLAGTVNLAVNPYVEQPLLIEEAMAAPNPMNASGGSVSVNLAGGADEIKIKIYTPGMTAVIEDTVQGPFRAWSQVKIPDSFFQSAANGIYYAVITANRDNAESEPIVIKFLLLK